MSAPGNRKMRRSREATTSNDESLSGFDIYEVQGDAATAYEVFALASDRVPSPSKKDASMSKSSTARNYNLTLLSKLSEKKRDPGLSLCDDMLKAMDEHDTRLKKDSSSTGADYGSISSEKLKRNELIVAYNRALVLYAKREYKPAIQTCLDRIRGPLTGNEKPSEELTSVYSRLAFLLLECIFDLSAGRVDQASSSEAAATALGLDVKDIPSTYDIVTWLDQFETENDPQFKFQMNLYRSRVELTELDENGKHGDNKVRVARKELKQAMDVLQHRLRPSYGAETGSVVSSANSEENLSSSSGVPYDQQLPSSVVLQKHNQCALNLKANSEQLKGNTKKSLILCSEALAAAAAEPTYEAVHDNNLAVVYGTIGKRHLALHALAKGLRTKGYSSFHGDGTPNPDNRLLILHNTAVCSLLARNYLVAYECMATCIASSELFLRRPRCWVRLAEACVGIYSDLKNSRRGPRFSAVAAGSHEPKAIVLDNAMFNDHPEIINEKPVASIASKEDIEQVKKNPMIRARCALEYIMEKEKELGDDMILSVRLTLAYVYLAFREYEKALEQAKLVSAAPEHAETKDDVSLLTRKRQIATARMYAAEACCALGDTVNAMKFLVGDGQDDAFDRLASDLSGVTLETASSNGKGKRRLARGQTVVRSSASVVTAAMGNLTAAKQLAMSAQAMEDAYASDRQRSTARRALIYTLLRGGHHGPALSLLRSLR